MTWNGDIPAQKWVNFYMKVLTKITAGANLQLTLRVVASNDQGVLTAEGRRDARGFAGVMAHHPDDAYT